MLGMLREAEMLGKVSNRREAIDYLHRKSKQRVKPSKFIY